MAQTAEALTPDARAYAVDVLQQILSEMAVTRNQALEFASNATGFDGEVLGPIFDAISNGHYIDHEPRVRRRILALGEWVDMSFSSAVQRSKVDESRGHRTATEMLSLLIRSEETLAATCMGAAEASEGHGDMVTPSIMTDLTEDIENNIAKLKSFLR